MYAMSDYISHDTNVYRCPALNNVYKKSGFSYFMGSAPFTDSGNGSVSPSSVILRSIATPSLFVLSGDCNYPADPSNADLNNKHADTLFSIYPADGYPRGGTVSVENPHNNRLNVMFADSHIKNYKTFSPRRGHDL